ncbi:hypothetical protein ACFLZ2_04540 [Candidatus Margulisiibacteriota bacterium]
MGIEKLSAIDPNTAYVFKKAGFNDKDRDGAIRKQSPKNRQIRNEGYIPEADIDMDGKIVGAEAKLYLIASNNRQLTPTEKREYAITDKDRAVLAQAYADRLKRAEKTIKDPVYKEVYLGDISIGLAYAGLYKESSDVALQLKLPLRRAAALRDMSYVAAMVGQTDISLVNRMREKLVGNERQYLNLALFREEKYGFRNRKVGGVYRVLITKQYLEGIVMVAFIKDPSNRSVIHKCLVQSAKKTLNAIERKAINERVGPEFSVHI